MSEATDPAAGRFIIMKKTRAMDDWLAIPDNAYCNLATCERAGVEPGLTYANLEDAERDALKLTGANGVGFVVVRLAEGAAPGPGGPGAGPGRASGG